MTGYRFFHAKGWTPALPELKGTLRKKSPRAETRLSTTTRRGVGVRVFLGVAVSVLLLMPGATQPAQHKSHLAGPVRARLLQVIDGDTLFVQAQIWPGQLVETHVRLIGVDTPEIKGACATERATAEKARAYVVGLLGDDAVVLNNIRFGKYAGRVLARVTSAAGVDVAGALIERGLGRAYDGGRRKGWCP